LATLEPFGKRLKEFAEGRRGQSERKGVSPEHLHKSSYGLGFCPVEARGGLKVEPDEQNEFKLE
jgi:hypothetical protein